MKTDFIILFSPGLLSLTSVVLGWISYSVIADHSSEAVTNKDKTFIS